MERHDTRQLLARAQQAFYAGDHGQAGHCCQEILRLQPEHAEATYMLGILAFNQGRTHEALRFFQQSASLQPESGAFHNALGEAYQSLRILDQAERCFKMAVSVQPGFERAHLNLGILLHGRGDLEAAAAKFAEAVRVNPNYAPALNNLGGVLQTLERSQEAVPYLRRAIAIMPAYPEAHYNLGAALLSTGDPTSAMQSFHEALRQRPGYARARASLAQCLLDLGLVEASLPHFEILVNANPDADTLVRYAEALRVLGRLDEAATVVNLAINRFPDDARCLANRLRLKAELCDWTDWNAEEERLWQVTEVEIQAGRPSPIQPMSAMSLSWSPERQLAVARSHARMFDRFKSNRGTDWHAASKDGRIRVGYLSRDFYEPHPVAYQIQALFGLHDRNRFAVHVYSFAPPDAGPVRQRISRECESFCDVSALSVGALVQKIRDDGIQILVDLMGYSALARPACLASRPAPIQVSWLGYSATMGADFIDYIIGDQFVTPIGAEGDFSEKIVRLPHSYMSTNDKQPIDSTPANRAEHGLPEQAMVYCCFNSAHKILPNTFDSWMRILSIVPGSIAWLSVRDKSAQNNLRREAQTRGINPDRLIFSKHVTSKAAHLRRLALADLFLDTHYYQCSCHRLRCSVGRSAGADSCRKNFCLARREQFTHRCGNVRTDYAFARRL